MLRTVGVAVAALCVAVAIVAHPLSAEAQSASKVIERHINAIGGKKAVEKIDSTDVSGRISSADGRSGVFVQRTKRPLLFSVNMASGDSRWRAGFNGRSAWQEDSVEGLRTLYGQAASRVRAEASYANTRFVMPDKVNQVSVAGRDQVRGQPVIVAVAVTPDGTKRTLFFDASSYLLLKDEQQTEAGLEERFFDDYRPVDQVMEPHRIEWHRNGETFRIAVERVTHNAPLDGQAFDVPAAPGEPPLAIDAVLSAAERTEQQVERVRESYVYTQTLTYGVVDKQGRVTQKDGSSWEIFHLGGRPVGRLVTKMGGQALSETERRREDERVTNIVREYERQRLSRRTERLGQEEPSASVFAMRDLFGSVFLRMPVMTAGWFPAYLRMSDFSNIRREQVRGRAAVVVEFQPRRGAVPNGDLERQAGAMAGTWWIDEASSHVIRFESYFRDDDDPIVKGSSVLVERTLVNDEVWLPSRSESNLRRTSTFALIQVLAVIRYTDHKKFNVDTDSKVTLPNQ
jgi:membrane protein implicated in regulation of membrane protease activity